MGLREDLQSHTVNELILRPYAPVRSGATVSDAVTAMKAAGIGAAMILDESCKPIGMFNEKILIRLLANNPDALSEPVEQHMTRHVVCVRRDQPIATLISVMQENTLRWVCVTDEQGRAEFLTGLRGVLEYVTDYFPREVKVQPDESRLAMDQREGA